MRWLVVAFLLALATPLLAGCTAGGCSNTSDGQQCAAPGALTYNGSSTGTQTSKEIECGTETTFSYSVNMGGGSVTFTVYDGAGVNQFSRTIDDVGQHNDDAEV